MAAGADVVRHARRLTGYTYKFGGELDPLGPPGDCDCSELVEWAVAQAGAADGTGVRITDGSWLQYEACDHIPLDQALTMTGALVFLSKTDPPQEGRDGVYHVGIVDAEAGEVVEACCSDGDRIQPSPIGARGWFHTAGLIPGITYEEDDVALTDDDVQRVAWAVWSFVDPAGGEHGPSAATRLRALADEVEQIPGRVINYPIPMIGATPADLWTLIRETYYRVTSPPSS